MKGDRRNAGSKPPALPPLPRLESTYSVILQRAIGAARKRSGFTQRVKSATRELAALVPHTRARFRGLSAGAKALVAVLLVSVGAALALGAVLLLGSTDPMVLRARARAQLAAGDFLGAKDTLAALRRGGALTDDDRLTLVTDVEEAMSRLRHDLQERVEADRRDGRWDDSLAALDEMERAGFAGEWMLFTRAELHRLAGRHGSAKPYYRRYVELHPSSERADDALFWEAEAFRLEGDRAEARRLLEELLEEYPGTNFTSSARRFLSELQ